MRSQHVEELDDPVHRASVEPTEHQLDRPPEGALLDRLGDRGPHMRLVGCEGREEGRHRAMAREREHVVQVNPAMPAFGRLRDEITGVAPPLHGGIVHVQQGRDLRGRQDRT